MPAQVCEDAQQQCSNMMWAHSSKFEAAWAVLLIGDSSSLTLPASNTNTKMQCIKHAQYHNHVAHAFNTAVKQTHGGASHQSKDDYLACGFHQPAAGPPLQEGACRCIKHRGVASTLSTDRLITQAAPAHNNTMMQKQLSYNNIDRSNSHHQLEHLQLPRA
jgi:hypothetical protein